VTSGGLIVRGRPIVARHEGGHRFTLRIREHELIVDQPRGSGGEDAEPSPTELFVASLVGCVAHYGHMFLARHGLSGDITAEADWSVDLGSEQLSAVEVRLDAPAIPVELEVGFREAVDHCLVHNSLRSAPYVAIEVCHAAAAESGSV
jgi:uncharacterized OsmC-like protein